MAVDLGALLRSELAAPPVDLSPLARELAELRQLVAALVERDLAPPDALIGLDEVCIRTGWGRTSVLHQAGRGTFPQSVDRGDSRRVWRASEVDAWIKQLPTWSATRSKDAR